VLWCRDVRDKIVAYNGKFIEVQEVRGASNANGTGFAITLGACPLLDQTNLGGSLLPFHQIVKLLGRFFPPTENCGIACPT